ncbi:SGNH/GDSL hydrolase family protein [Janibacter melonis]
MGREMTGLLVAVGDSFTEGIGDPHLHYPNSVRGWADRLARQLGRADPTWRYANLAIRSKFLDQVVADQLDAALALGPTHVTFYAGGNDLLSLRADLTSLLGRYEAALDRLVGSGAQVVLFTAYDVRTTRLLDPLVRRVHLFNDGVRELADRHGTLLVDHARVRDFDHPALWAPDRIHMSRQGHKRMAALVAETMGVPHTLKIGDLVPHEPRGWRHVARQEAAFVRQEVVPLVRRRLRREYEGDRIAARWPEPIRPAEGMKRLAAARALEAATLDSAGVRGR